MREAASPVSLGTIHPQVFSARSRLGSSRLNRAHGEGQFPSQPFPIGGIKEFDRIIVVGQHPAMFRRIMDHGFKGLPSQGPAIRVHRVDPRRLEEGKFRLVGGDEKDVAVAGRMDAHRFENAPEG